MKNQTQQGDALNLTAPSPSGFVSGNGYQVGAAIFGVAGFTAPATTTGVLWLRGVYTLSKISAQAWAVGDIIYWSPTQLVATNVNSSSDLKIGVAVAAAANPTATGSVRLAPG